jgi:pyruvate,water dikinase
VTSLLARIRSLLGGARHPGPGLPPFPELLARFRAVLEESNRTLETITGMGETLGGDYLFDSTYLGRAYQELAAGTKRSLGAFDALTGCRNEALHDVFARLDLLIRMAVENRRGTTPRPLLFLEEITWELAHDVGGKSAGLAELKNDLRLAVPDGFALTTWAFDRFLRENLLEEPIAALDGTPADGGRLADLRARILAGAIPGDIASALEAALATLRTRTPGLTGLAVRSSAGDEDGDYSFAGQFASVLNVPLESPRILAAYRTVLASLFSEKSAAYQRSIGSDLRAQKMAVCCLGMVEAVSSGVLFTVDPQGPRDRLLVNAAWGLGESLVEGRIAPDTFVVRKGDPPEILASVPGEKDHRVAPRPEGGVERLATSPEQRRALSLTPEQVLELARVALVVERRSHAPRDIEWAVDGRGRIVLLQSRPLRVQEQRAPAPADRAALPSGTAVLLEGSGTVVQKGSGAGRVFLLRAMTELETFPRGAVLVARNDSSEFITVMPYAAAIVTDVGTPTSHMASLCRELRIPTVVNTGRATQVLTHGEPVTVVAGDDGGAVYAGTMEVGGSAAGGDGRTMEQVYEYRRKRYLLRYIVPLHLIDPLRDEFTPERCRSLHDLLRYVHEKSVMTLIERARHGGGLAGTERAVRLELPVPVGIIVIDIGGGLSPGPSAERATLDQVASVPLRALLAGMAQPGVWRTDAVAFGMGDLVTSMFRLPDPATTGADYLYPNLAVASAEYVNLNLRFGYHFTVLDAFCGDRPRHNHVYFRFFGGATDLDKRSRRVQVIAAILEAHRFTTQVKGDLITARLANIERGELEAVLVMLGRLLGYTRQLDAQLGDEGAVERAARRFLDEARPG